MALFRRSDPDHSAFLIAYALDFTSLKGLAVKLLPVITVMIPSSCLSRTAGAFS